MKPTVCRPSEVANVALSLGFWLERSSGSHRIYKNKNGSMVVIPFHPGDVSLGTLRSIINQLGITVEEFNQMV